MAYKKMATNYGNKEKKIVLTKEVKQSNCVWEVNSNSKNGWK